MSSCPDRAALAAWARGGSAAGEIAAHVATCSRCRERATRSRDDDELLGDLRGVARGTAELQIAGYRIDGELRRGGQGVVYRAIQEATRRAVALKVLAREGAASARERRRFEREIELASRLRHPFLVTVFDSGAAAGEPWYAMELVDGQPLDEWVRAAQPTLRARVELFAQICDAVAYAHRRGVIHRDLKPTNVLVDADGKPRVLDFGVARDLEDGALRVTAPGEFLGTLAYAAPEQLRRDAGAIDTRTDVYALGLVLHELLCGRLPGARAASIGELVDSAALEAVEPPSRIAREIDGELDAIVLRALARDPAARYGSAEALERDVRRYLAGEPLEARALSARYVLRRALARHRTKLIAAGAMLAVALVAAGAWWRDHARAAQQRDQTALVRSVFQDILGAAAPQRMGGNVRLLEVFELAARRIESSLDAAPDVQAEVELTIGDTYRRLLRPSEAEPHLRRALERFEAVDDRRELEVARCANLLGLALSDQNQREAIALQERALKIRERELPAGDLRIRESERSLAIALLAPFRDVDTERARALLERALAGFRAAANGRDDAECAATELTLARVDDDPPSAESETLLAHAATTFQHIAPDDPRAIDAFNAHANSLQRSGSFDEAREWLDRSVAAAQKLFGDELATDMLRNYARLEFARGDPRAAEQLSRQAIAHELGRWAERRPDEAARLRALAQRIQQPGSPAAEPPYAEAFAALRSFVGDGAFELAQWINGIALTLRDQGRTAATEAMLREALAIRCRALGSDCPVRQRTIELYAEALIAQSAGRRAIDLLEESLATFARRDESQSSGATHAAELLAVCRAQTPTEAGAR